MCKRQAACADERDSIIQMSRHGSHGNDRMHDIGVRMAGLEHELMHIDGATEGKVDLLSSLAVEEFVELLQLWTV